MLKKSKGFTLFTALVGFIIIGIGVLVMQHMSNSEQNYQNLLNSLLTQQEMDSSIHMIKLDAISAFDLLYRVNFYDYYVSQSSVDSGIPIVDANNWPDYKKGYILETFGIDITQDVDANEYVSQNKLSGYVTNKILALLSDYRGNYKGENYFFRIYDYALQNADPEDLSLENAVSATKLSGTHLALSINESSQGPEFLNILDCENNDCQRGSFYTNLDFTKINYGLYVYLPRILIINNLDKSQIDDAILPYSKLSLYLPMRLFGAFYLAYNKIENFSTDELSKEYGHTNFPNCGNIMSLDDLNIPKTDFQSLISDITTIYNNNDFDLNITEITENRSYPTEIMVVKISDEETMRSLIKRKVSSVNLKIKIKDNDVYENIGRMPMNYLLTGTKENINEFNPNLEITYCYCNVESGANNNKILGCSEINEKPTELKTTILEALGDFGLTEEQKKEIANNSQ